MPDVVMLDVEHIRSSLNEKTEDRYIVHQHVAVSNGQFLSA
jgi:hypothetical protein